MIIFFLVVPQIHSSKLLSQADIFLAAKTCWISKYWSRLACWQCFKQQERLLSLTATPSYQGSIQSRHFSNSTIDWGKLLKFVPLHTCFCNFFWKNSFGSPRNSSGDKRVSIMLAEKHAHTSYNYTFIKLFTKIQKWHCFKTYL